MRIGRRSILCVVVVAVALAGGCSAARDDAGAPAPRGPATSLVVPEGFREVTVTVVDADGGTRTFCLWLADTPEARERGLMHVTDPALGGRDGMVFVFEEDTGSGFWMRNTRLPLSIAWIGADGATVSTTDMEPCPDSEATCPIHPSGGTYRMAIEVPKGRLGELGISDRSRVTLGERGCHTA